MMDISVADLPDWLSTMPETLRPSGLTVSQYFPRHFEAYCRVLNPARTGFGTPSRWQSLTDEPVNGLTQWCEVEGHTREPDGSGHYPVMGAIDTETAAALTDILKSHTTTPTETYYLAWEGYGGLNDSYRASSSVFAPYGRPMFVLAGPLREAVSAAAAVPNGAPLWWAAADGSWCLGNDIYARSVYLGGTAACVQDLLNDTRIESYPVSSDQIVVPEDQDAAERD